jgi:hypothetical protein
MYVGVNNMVITLLPTYNKWVKHKQNPTKENQAAQQMTVFVESKYKENTIVSS